MLTFCLGSVRVSYHLRTGGECFCEGRGTVAYIHVVETIFLDGALDYFADFVLVGTLSLDLAPVGGRTDVMEQNRYMLPIVNLCVRIYCIKTEGFLAS